MIRCLSLVLVVLFPFTSLSCSNSSVVQTGQVIVQFDHTVDFSQFETFSVVTAEIANPPDLDEDQEAFNDMVNELIVEAMQEEPVCLTFISPEEVTDENQPDLWAANGLAQTTGEGYDYDCIGGWWWGYWGWYWDPCKWWVPRYIEYDVGNLLIPVGPPPAEGEEAEPIFGGLAQSLSSSPPDVETKVREAVQAIFQQWPHEGNCESP